MISVLIEKLQNEPNIELSQSRAERLWERFEDGFAHFAVVDNQIVGCCVIWHDTLRVNTEPNYVELGTVWIQKHYRTSALLEIGNNIRRIAKGKKILGFCKNLTLARFFVMNPIFPMNVVANWKSCPPEIIRAYQLEGWYPADIVSEDRYTRVLYREQSHRLTPWYLIYEK
jgi:hypothetical protein